ncbi:MarR family transcriptional regulator [Limosilactobacillus ingluviei]|uniref:MarR family transcriptional regulator n=1 Tax=Limosilactobacillus ingluviei TaxID=148604 RepID=UPI0023F3F652|nr:helix-turn-helix domain-containing protein [Limosilactobacillus ingluviei]
MTRALTDWLKLQSLTQQIDQELTAALQTLVDQISLNEFYVLHFLEQAEGQPLRVNDLSAKLGLSQSATSRMLTRFERTYEVIERQPNSVDRFI